MAKTLGEIYEQFLPIPDRVIIKVSSDPDVYEEKGWADIIGIQNPLAVQGTWNADTNTPDISSTTQTGYFWIVTTAGSTNLGGITDWGINDWAVKTDSGWAKVDNTDSVTSVNGKIGIVVLSTADVDDTTDKRYVTDQEKTDIVDNTAKVSFPEAPEDGKQYARKDVSWEEIASAPGTSGYWIDYAETPTGDGSSGNPYLIEKAEHLAWVAKMTNTIDDWSIDKYFTLDFDYINLAGKEWSPIGVGGQSYNRFEGLLTTTKEQLVIDNMTITKEQKTGHTGSYVGLFGYIYNSDFHNTNLTNTDLHITNIFIASDKASIGGFAGYSYYYRAKLIKVTGTIINFGGVEHTEIGGIYGNAKSSTKLINLDSNVAIYTNADDAVGGIGGGGSPDMYTAGTRISRGDIHYYGDSGGAVGGCYGVIDTAYVQRSINYGNIYLYGGYTQQIGGVVGWASNLALECINCGNIIHKGSTTSASYSYIGGIIGYSGGASNCINFGKISIPTTNTVYIGGISGYMSSNKTMLNCYNVGYITEAGGDIAKTQGLAGLNAGTTTTSFYLENTVLSDNDATGLNLSLIHI